MYLFSFKFFQILTSLSKIIKQKNICNISIQGMLVLILLILLAFAKREKERENIRKNCIIKITLIKIWSKVFESKLHGTFWSPAGMVS